MLLGLNFSSGGVKTLAFIGCLRVLEEQKALDSVKVVCGTSGGAIIGLLFSLGYTSADMEKISAEQLRLLHSEKKSFLSILTNCGISSGEAMESNLRSFIKAKLGSENATFQDLLKQRGITFVATAVRVHQNWTPCDLVNFSPTTTPDMPLWQAVRASSSIPLFFVPTKYKSHYYVDGAVLSSFSEETIEEYLPGGDHQGFFILSAPHTSKLNEDNCTGDPPAFEDYLMSLVLGVMKSCDRAAIAVNPKKTVVLEIDEVSPIQFDITADEITKLISLGNKAMIAFLKKRS